MLTSRKKRFSHCKLSCERSLVPESSRQKFMKKIIPKVTLFAISFLFVGMALTSLAHAQPFMKNAVAVWLFDEERGKQVTDFARNGHDGEFKGKPERVPGKFGMALEFGGAEENQWVEIERPVEVDSVDLTVGCWLNPGTPQHHHANVLAGRPADGSDAGIVFAQYENAVNTYRIVIGGAFNWQGLGNPRNSVRIDNDIWTHVVFVRKGRGGTWYKNGEPDRPKRGDFHIDIGNTKPANPSDVNFRIGISVWNEDRRYRGILDEAFIFERAMSQEEVQKVMNEGFEEAQNVDSKAKTATVWGKIKATN